MGVHPIDDETGRRPVDTSTARFIRRSVVDPAVGHGTSPGTTRDERQTGLTEVTRLLFPEAIPDLPEAMAANGERMSLAYVVGVLMGNRDLERRVRAEALGEPVGVS